MKYCINCGTQLEDQMRFCSECGTEQPAGQAQNSSGPSGGASASEANFHCNDGAGAQPAQATNQANSYGGNFAPQYPYGANGANPMPPYSGMQQVKPKSNGLAIAGFVVSLCAILFILIPVVGLLISLTALGLSIAGMIMASRTKGANGMAVAGLVLSLIFGLTSIYYLVSGYLILN